MASFREARSVRFSRDYGDSALIPRTDVTKVTVNTLSLELGKKKKLRKNVLRAKEKKVNKMSLENKIILLLLAVGEIFSTKKRILWGRFEERDMCVAVVYVRDAM